MITVHRATLTPEAAATELNTHGLGIVMPEKARRKRKINGNNSVQITIPLNGIGCELLTEDRIICYRGQCYRIIRPKKKGAGHGESLEVEALHVFWDLAHSHIVNIETAEDDRYPDGITARQALEQVLDGTPFSVGEVTVDSSRLDYLDLLQVDRITAIRQIIQKWGGELELDNWTVSLKEHIGQDRGYTMRRGKNIREIEYQEDISTVITRLHIIGYQGASIEGINDGKDYIDSQYINRYAFPREGNVVFDDVDDPQELLALGQEYLTTVETPSATYRVSLAAMRGSTPYAAYAGLEQYELGDTARVIHETLGLDFNVRCVECEEDCLTGDLVSVTLGTPQKTIIASIAAGVRATALLDAVLDDRGRVRVDRLSGKITADELEAQSVTAQHIAAEAVTAGKIAAGAIQAAHLSTEVLETVDARIGSASIGYAQIKDASVQNLIARDAVTDRYFIDKLAVRSAQMVQATVGELVVKASDGRYYRLDVAADGSVSPTQVTPTAAEIAAGVTSDGHGAIIETDLTVAELSASNMKAINALIDKLTAGRIDVDTLFARQATVDRLLAMDITGNQYLRLMVKRTFSQWTDPAADPLISFVQDGDIWDRNSHIRTWNELGEFTWNQAAAYRWVDLEASDQFVRRDGEWTPMNLNTQARAVQAQMLLEQDALKLRVDSQETDIAGLKARVTTVETVYSEQGIRDIIATEFTEQIDGLIDDAAGEAIEKLLSTRLAFLQWEEPAGTEEDPLIDGMVWAKDHGYRTWNDVSAVPWAEMESCTWDSFLGPRFYVYKSGAWVLVTDYGRQVSETVRLDRTVEGVSANTERIARVGDHLSSLTAEFTVGFGEITARVTQVEADVDTKYTVQSGVEILPAGIEISGGKYVKIKSGGLFTVESGNFSIDGSGNVSLTGAITSQSGTIGGWTLEADKLSSGSGTNYVHVASGGTYAFLAGNATPSSAPFRVKRDGTVYLTKLIALDENNQETNVNLRTAGLWKLGSANIKNASVSGSTLTIQRYSGGDLTVNFNTAASVTLESAWSGSGREHTFTVTASNGQSAGAKLTLSTYGDDYTSFNASHKKQITVGATGIGHPGGSGLVYQFDVDASGVFQEGKASVTLTVGAWTNGKAAVTASNGQTAEVSLPAFSAAASAFLNHKSTVTFATPSVQAALKTVTVDATEEYEAGQASVTLTVGAWTNGKAAVTASNGQTAEVSLPAFSAAASAFLNHKSTVTFATPSVQAALKTVTVDATEEYEAGQASVTLTVGAWTNGKAAVTASNGQTAEVSLPAFSASASAFLNHKSTVAFSTPSVQAALKTVTVDATEEYEAGVAAGEAEFTEYSGYTLYRVSNGNYRNLELFRRYTNPGGGYSYESVGSGYVQVTESGIPTLYQKTE